MCGDGGSRLKKKLQPEMANILLVVAGLVIAAMGYNLYLLPNHIAAGGFTGIGQLIHHFIAINVGTINIILNVPLFILSMRSMGMKFGVRSLLAMVGFSLLIDYLPIPPATDDLLLAAVYGGLFNGIGFGLILRANTTTGGTDMLATLLNKLFPPLKINYGIFIIDGLVVATSAFVFEPQAAMYALISIFITNVMIDLVLEGPNSANSYFIISEKSDDIARRIMDEMDRGVTALEGMGMYHGTRKHVLLCVVNRFESMRLRKIVFAVDPRAFVIANKAHEVLGEGFKTAD